MTERPERTPQSLPSQIPQSDYKAVFDAAPCMLLVLTPDFRMVAANWARFSGTNTSPESVMGRSIFEVFPDNPSDPDATGAANLRSSLERVLQTKQPDRMSIQRYDIPRPPSEGGGFEERFWSPTNTPVLGSSGEVQYIIHKVDDVTDSVRREKRETEYMTFNQQLKTEIERRRQTEEDLRRLHHELEVRVELRTSELKLAYEHMEAFAYTISHDLRAPLRSMAGFSDALLKRYSATLDEQGNDFLRRIRSSAERLGTLIDALIQLSRISRAPLKQQEVDLTLMAHRVIDDLTRSNQERRITWKIQPGLQTRGDPILLRNVLQNLLGNALKYSSKSDAPLIEFGTVEGSSPTTYFIRDNGAGYESKYSDKLFQPFKRLHSDSEFPGTGIGLATVKRIIARHHGIIWSQGELGKGATFYFTLGLNPQTQETSTDDTYHLAG